jgi:hypothetical protein
MLRVVDHRRRDGWYPEGDNPFTNPSVAITPYINGHGHMEPMIDLPPWFGTLLVSQ